jgi:succinyl-CoA synthetase beta subunit
MSNLSWLIFLQVLLGNKIFNLFRADIIALGLIKGVSALGMKKPIVLRMKGTNI